MINRRRILQGAAVLGASTMLPLRSFAQTPKKGGRLRIAWSYQSAGETLELTKVEQFLDYIRAYQVMSPLIRWSPNFEPTPDLATSWEPNADATEWRFKLRRGVEFHDGKSMTPADVIYSLNLHRGGSASVVKGYFKDVEDIVVDGADTIVVKLKSADVTFPLMLGAPQLCVVPENFSDWHKPIGTGPFRVQNFDPGVGMLATKFKNYYSADTVHLDEVETFGIGNTEARVNALLAGDVDYISTLGSNNLSPFNGNSDVDVVKSMSGRFLCFVLYASKPPFKNKDLRRAVQYAIDREGMVKNLLSGFGVVANDVPAIKGDIYYPSDLEQRSYDPDKARFHYKKSGFSGKLELFASDKNYGATAMDYSLHLQQSAKRAGIDININRLPVDGYFAAARKTTFYPAVFSHRPDLDLTLRNFYLNNATAFDAGYTSEKIDPLAMEARRTLDKSRRSELYNQIIKILHEEDGRAIPIVVSDIYAKSARLQGVENSVIGEAGGYRMAETAWLA